MSFSKVEKAVSFFCTTLVEVYLSNFGSNSLIG